MRDEILKKVDLAEETVYIPQWETYLIVRALSASERSRVVRMAFDDKGNPKFDSGLIGPLLIASVRDPETKEKVFTPDDMDALLEKNAQALQKLFEVAARLAGLDTMAAKRAEKNSFGATESDSSITG